MVRSRRRRHHSVQVIPAVLVCSGKVSVPPGAKRIIYSHPYIKIRTSPLKRIKTNIEWWDDVSITVPIFYDEATQAKDVVKFDLVVQDKSGRNRWQDAYASNDTYGRFDQFRKALRVILPRTVGRSLKKRTHTVTYKCNVSVSLDIKSRVSEYHKQFSINTDIIVQVRHTRGRVYDNAVGFVVYAGIHVKSEFESKLTLTEWEELIEKERYEKWLYKRYLDNKRDIACDEEDGF